MRTNPISDTIEFLTGSSGNHANIGWGGTVFVVLSSVLVIGSIAIAIANWQADPAQRSFRHLAMWLMRTLIGGMWLEGSLWKLPLPVSGGFTYWLGLLGQNAAWDFYGALIRTLLIPNIALINSLIFMVEVALAASLMLGLAVRLTSLLGIAMSINLWIGLYHFGPEWPWIYVFIAMLHFFFIIDRAGRALGLDAIALRVRTAWFQRNPLLLWAV